MAMIEMMIASMIQRWISARINAKSISSSILGSRRGEQETRKRLATVFHLRSEATMQVVAMTVPRTTAILTVVEHRHPMTKIIVIVWMMMSTKATSSLTVATSSTRAAKSINSPPQNNRTSIQRSSTGVSLASRVRGHSTHPPKSSDPRSQTATIIRKVTPNQLREARRKGQPQ